MAAAVAAGVCVTFGTPYGGIQFLPISKLTFGRDHFQHRDQFVLLHGRQSLENLCSDGFLLFDISRALQKLW